MAAKKTAPCEVCWPGGWPIAGADGEPVERVACVHGTYDAPSSS